MTSSEIDKLHAALSSGDTMKTVKSLLRDECVLEVVRRFEGRLADDEFLAAAVASVGQLMAMDKIVAKDAALRGHLSLLANAIASTVAPHSLLDALAKTATTLSISNVNQKSASIAFLCEVSKCYKSLPDKSCTETLNSSLIRAANLLIVPGAFDCDLETLTDDQTWNTIKTFQKDAPLLLSILTSILSVTILENKSILQDETISTIIARSLAFSSIPDTKSPWTGEDAHSAATCLLATISSITARRHPSLTSSSINSENDDTKPNSLPTHVSSITIDSKLASRILSTEVKPFFEKSIAENAEARNPTPRRVPGKPVKSKQLVGERFQDQPWKHDRVECVHIFEGVVSLIKAPHLAPIQHLIIPTVLTLIDDYDPVCKARGIRIFRQHVLPNLDSDDFARTGLGDVFFEVSLRICLTYHSTPPVLQESFQTITLLVQTLSPPQTTQSLLRLHKITQESIVGGLRLAIGGKLVVIRAILAATPQVLSQLGSSSITYLQPLVALLCEILAMHAGDVETQIVCGAALVRLMEECWVRVGFYRGVILRAVGVCWMEIERVEEVEKRDMRLWKVVDQEGRDTVRKLLKDIVVLLVEICGDAIKPDMNVMLELNKPMFGKLLSMSIETDNQQ